MKLKKKIMKVKRELKYEIEEKIMKIKKVKYEIEKKIMKI